MSHSAHGSEPKNAGPTMYAAIAILVPLAAFGGYRLADKLRQNPEDAQGWAPLGRTYKVAQHYSQARDAFKHALYVEPGDAGLQDTQPKGSTHITVKVVLDPKLKANVLPGDVLFVFAKAAQGPAMPLAIARLTAAQLPASVTLTDAMSMMPNLTLSKFPQIVLGARISQSGNPIAQSGDIQTLSAAVSNSRADPISLTIDRTVQ